MCQVRSQLSGAAFGMANLLHFCKDVIIVKKRESHMGRGEDGERKENLGHPHHKSRREDSNRRELRTMKKVLRVGK